MNLDESVASVTEVELGQGLLHWVNEWKNDESDIVNLAFMIAKWHGNVWFKDTSESDGFHTKFEAFNKIAIRRYWWLNFKRETVLVWSI